MLRMSSMAQMVKNLTVMWDTQVQFLDWEDLLERNGYLLQYPHLKNSIDKNLKTVYSP